MEELQSSRLILRPLTVSDAEPLFELFRDPQTMRFMGSRPASVEDEKRHIARQKSDLYPQGVGLRALVLRASLEVVGYCGLLPQLVEGNQEWEVTYLVQRKYWGMGLATEAVVCAVEEWKKKRSEPRLVALVHPDNIASAKVARKSGFRSEGKVLFKGFGMVDLYVQGRG
jgi:ribosomal-protein-alanine N-acetyltransferase